MILWLFCFSVLLGVLAIFDYRDKKVPDLLVSGLLLVCVVAWVGNWEFGYFYFGLFAILYFVNSIAVNLLGKPFLSWADVLVFPAIEVTMRSLGFFYPALYVALAIAFAVSIRNKERVPGIPFFAAAFAFATVLFCLTH